ncbi:MAG: hypothetical protein IPH11_16815 [Ignavibacteriales bacterium]|nr:hypothetical protein [Ignavibacteriales bacterium]
MYQNLVVSPLFLKCFTPLESDKAFNIMANLITEIFLCDRDKKLLEEYDKLKEKHKHTPQSFLFIESFINNVTLGKIKIAENITVKNRKDVDWNLYESEKSIVAFDEWKIILTNDSNPEMKMKLESEVSIELSDTNNYLIPAEKSRIRTIQRINKLPDDEFDFKNWLQKFLIDTRNLIIHDGYAFAKREIRDVEFIIDTLPKGSTVSIITLTDKARNGSRYNDLNDGIVAEEELQKLKNRFPQKIIKAEFREEKKLIEDRHLQTDKFIIDTGHALGSTYKDIPTGKILCRKQFTITVSRLPM